MKWTPETIEELLRRYRLGHTATEIGAHFGVTKNTIIGKVDRELIKSGERVPRQVKSDTVSKRKYTRRESMLTLPSRALSVSAYVSPPVAVPDEGQLASIVDVTGCRWPVRDDAAFVGGQAFCNHAQDGASSYCPYHKQASQAPYSRTLIRETTKSALYIYKRAA
jgi:hypothetical protein